MALRLASSLGSLATLRTCLRSNSRVFGSSIGLRPYSTEGEVKDVVKKETPSPAAPKGNIGMVSLYYLEITINNRFVGRTFFFLLSVYRSVPT